MDAPAPARHRRPLVALLGGIFAFFGALFLPFALGLVGEPTPPTPGPAPQFVVDAIAVFIVSVLPITLGLWMVHRGAPGLPRRIMNSLASTLGSAFSRQRLVASPLRRAVLAFLICLIGAIILPRGAKWGPIFVALVWYSFVDPLTIAMGTRWWINAGKSFAGWLLLFVMAAAMGEIDKMGEAGMVFVLPMMVYPFALGISGLIRLVRWNLPPKGL
jgi:hypothetical protein